MLPCDYVPPLSNDCCFTNVTYKEVKYQREENSAANSQILKKRPSTELEKTRLPSSHYYVLTIKRISCRAVHQSILHLLWSHHKEYAAE